MSRKRALNSLSREERVRLQIAVERHARNRAIAEARIALEHDRFDQRNALDANMSYVVGARIAGRRISDFLVRRALLPKRFVKRRELISYPRLLKRYWSRLRDGYHN